MKATGGWDAVGGWLMISPIDGCGPVARGMRLGFVDEKPSIGPQRVWIGAQCTRIQIQKGPFRVNLHASGSSSVMYPDPLKRRKLLYLFGRPAAYPIITGAWLSRACAHF